MNLEKIPEFLKNMLIEQYGKDIANRIIDGYTRKRPVTLRVNTLKSNVSKIEKEFRKYNIEFEHVKWSDEALIIKNADEEKLRILDIYENGEIYFQSLSSMLPPIILDPKTNMDILDMAAAPGSKTTQLAALTQNQAHITACEMNKIRAERLKYNIEKQGASSVYVMVNDSRKIDDFFSFDQILLDSPCSGSGTLNVDMCDFEKTFTMKLLNKSTLSQLALLRKAVKILKPEHEMVYSTCSILSCENEDIVNKVLKEANVEIVPIKFKGMEDLPILPTKLDGTLCIAPNELFEGFFIAKLRKCK